MVLLEWLLQPLALLFARFPVLRDAAGSPLVRLGSTDHLLLAVLHAPLGASFQAQSPGAHRRPARLHRTRGAARRIVRLGESERGLVKLSVPAALLLAYSTPMEVFDANLRNCMAGAGPLAAAVPQSAGSAGGLSAGERAARDSARTSRPTRFAVKA